MNVLSTCMFKGDIGYYYFNKVRHLVVARLFSVTELLKVGEGGFELNIINHWTVHTNCK